MEYSIYFISLNEFVKRPISLNRTHLLTMSKLCQRGANIGHTIHSAFTYQINLRPGSNRRDSVVVISVPQQPINTLNAI